MILPYEAQDYKELESINEVFPLVTTSPSDWLVQLKYDGIWALIYITKGVAQIYSKTGQLKTEFRIAEHLISRDPIILIGEYMFASQWSQHASRKGAIYVFDCLQADGGDISHLVYRDRMRKLVGIVGELGEPFRITPCFNIDSIGKIWMGLEKEQTHEGLIVRKWSATWYTELLKIKLCVEDDYVILDSYEGTGKYEGMLGGFTVGQYDKDRGMVEVMDVGGGFSDQQRKDWWPVNPVLGQVCLVSGKARFTSGSLRHPAFERIRDDKQPKDCILKYFTFGLTQ